eukprot:TRINITY_DN62457_c0_g1_i1.p1 TRINITY_DN62457_c0_g1~~TRINITY_DN62457_c0_g1_i1.p1  ORF type:complete len:657 (-),score=91.03 TRINITY_DN62457_c0_g1_i1:46-1791(-)
MVGVVLCFSNMYFGLQTGWVTMGALQSSVVGFLIFQTCVRGGRGTFGPLENVVLQTVSVAVATMPLAGGFVGIIPALKLMNPPVVLTTGQQLLWCGSLAFFGIFVAVPLRRQVIVVEQLPFPSGTATAKLIGVLHAGAENADFNERWNSLSASFSLSIAMSLACFFWPRFQNLPVASWLGFSSLTAWHWSLRPSVSLFGQGMIMGMRSSLSMLLGAIVGWGILGPLAQAKGWASGPIDSWETGPQGWVLWVSIGLMLGEALTSFLFIVGRHLLTEWHDRGDRSGVGLQIRSSADRCIPREVAPPSELVPGRVWGGGLAVSLVACAAVLAPMFQLNVGVVCLGLFLSCLVSIVAVRALGQTDLNPVSGVGKLSQLVFAGLFPGQIVANLVAGAMAEAGAMQCGDLMQDLKTGHLLRASPRVQFVAQLIGAAFSVFVTVFAYHLYEVTYGIPSEQFAAPVARVWLDMAMLSKTGLSGLPPTAFACAGCFAAVGVVLASLDAMGGPRLRQFLPSGIAMGIGMYLTPDWTIPRVLGGLAEWAWRSGDPRSHEVHCLMTATGLVFGEGVMSMIALVLKACHVPTFG